MAEIVNLNKVRKAKARAEKEESAAANRAKFGRSKAEKAKVSAEQKRLDRNLDGSRRED
jgi:hypothetical protein